MSQDARSVGAIRSRSWIATPVLHTYIFGFGSCLSKKRTTFDLPATQWLNLLARKPFLRRFAHIHLSFVDLGEMIIQHLQHATLALGFLLQLVQVLGE